MKVKRVARYFLIVGGLTLSGSLAYAQTSYSVFMFNAQRMAEIVTGSNVDLVDRCLARPGAEHDAFYEWSDDRQMAYLMACLVDLAT